MVPSCLDLDDTPTEKLASALSNWKRRKAVAILCVQNILTNLFPSFICVTAYEL
jgi:hypothetical protein